MNRNRDVWGMKCPKCGRDSALEVQPVAWAELTPDGTDFDTSRDGTHEWGDSSPCQCTACGWIGTAGQARGLETQSPPRLNLAPDELATVLAALRYWQRKALGGPTVLSGLYEWPIATDSGQVEPLDESAVDALCERLNSI